MQLCLVRWPGRGDHEVYRSMVVVRNPSGELFLTDNIPNAKAREGETICLTACVTPHNVDYLIFYHCQKKEWHFADEMFKEGLRLFHTLKDAPVNVPMLFKQVAKIKPAFRSSFVTRQLECYARANSILFEPFMEKKETMKMVEETFQIVGVSKELIDILFERVIRIFNQPSLSAWIGAIDYWKNAYDATWKLSSFVDFKGWAQNNLLNHPFAMSRFPIVKLCMKAAVNQWEFSLYDFRVKNPLDKEEWVRNQTMPRPERALEFTREILEEIALETNETVEAMIQRLEREGLDQADSEAASVSD